MLQTQTEAKMQDKDKEVSEIKAKIVSLEAQLVEKSNKVSRLEKEVKQKLVGSSTAKSGGEKGPVPAPAIEVAHQDDQEQPVLINDPAGEHDLTFHINIFPFRFIWNRLLLTN